MKYISVYTRMLTILFVVVFRFRDGKWVKNAYCNPYPASVRRIAQLLANRDSVCQGESGVLIQNFKF